MAALSLEGCLNVSDLAQMLQLRERARATIVMQAVCSDNHSLMRQMDRRVGCPFAQVIDLGISVDWILGVGPLPALVRILCHRDRDGADPLKQVVLPYDRACLLPHLTPPTTTTSCHSLILCTRPRTAGSSVCMPLLKARATGASSQQPVVELRCCELASASMVDVVAQARADAAGELLVGLQRYAFHVPSLTDSLAHINACR